MKVIVQQYTFQQVYYTMKKVKQFFKLLALITLILLASVGIGLSGGAPIPSMRMNRDKEQAPIELVEEKDEEDSEETMAEIKG